MANLVELKIPDIGGSTDVNIAEVYIKVGDQVKVDDNLIMLETDKASMEVPAEKAGVIKELKIKAGMKVNEGDVIAIIQAQASEATKSDAPKAEATKVEKPKDTVSSAPKIEAPKPAPVATNNTPSAKIDEAAFSKAFASPSIRKFARELGVDLGKVKGSGDRGRITQDDVKSFVKQVLTSGASGSGVGLDLLPWPQVDFAKFGEVSKVELSRIKKLSGANLSRNWVMIPHVTQFDQADITDLEQFRKELNQEYQKEGIKITPLAFLIKASIYALKQFPEFNASLDGDSLVYKHYYNIGFAADTPNGLVVPVLKNADQLGITEIASRSSELAKLAREGKLKPNDMQGGTFTISSLGGIGGTAFTPIINAPEVAILGVSKSSMQPIYDGKNFVPRLMLPLSLSYDHRIIDGALAAKFTTYLAKLISDVRRLGL